MKSFSPSKLVHAIAWRRAALPSPPAFAGDASTAHHAATAARSAIDHAAVRLGIAQTDRIRALVGGPRTPHVARYGVLLSGRWPTSCRPQPVHGAKGMALNHGIYLESAQARRRSLVRPRAEPTSAPVRIRLGGKAGPFLRDYLKPVPERRLLERAGLEIEARERLARSGASRIQAVMRSAEPRLWINVGPQQGRADASRPA